MDIPPPVTSDAITQEHVLSFTGRYSMHTFQAALDDQDASPWSSRTALKNSSAGSMVTG